MRNHLCRRKFIQMSLGLLCLFPLFFHSCSETQDSGRGPGKTPNSDQPPAPAEIKKPEKKDSIPQDAFIIFDSFPHDPAAFTQGLTYRDGFLYESTGRYGKSSLRKTNPTTGKILARTDLPRKFFGEGLTIIGDSVYQLTWKSGRGFIYGKEDLKRRGEFTYSTEGWGLTDDGTHLIMSDGTEKLYFLSPKNFEVTKVLSVKENGSAVARLNELEYVEGRIYCNIWHSDDIVIVDPESGIVKRRISFGQLRERLSLSSDAGVLNGIAWKPSSRTFLVTGKNWSEVFEIRFTSP